jgi:hypothetical protein
VFKPPSGLRYSKVRLDEKAPACDRGFRLCFAAELRAPLSIGGINRCRHLEEALQDVIDRHVILLLDRGMRNTLHNRELLVGMR